MLRRALARVLKNRMGTAPPGPTPPVPPPSTIYAIPTAAGIAASSAHAGLAWKQTGVSTCTAFTSGQAMVETVDALDAFLWSYLAFGNQVGLDGSIGPAVVKNIAIGRIAGTFPTYSAATGNYNGPSGDSGNPMYGGGNGAEAGQGRQTAPAIMGSGSYSGSTIWAKGYSGGANGLPAVPGSMNAVSTPSDLTIVNSTDEVWRRYLGRSTNAQPACEIRHTGAGTDLGDVRYWGMGCNQRATYPVHAMVPLTDDTLTSQAPVWTGVEIADFWAGGVLDFQISMKTLFRYANDFFGREGSPAGTEYEIFTFTGASGSKARAWFEYGNGDSSYRIWFSVTDGTLTDTISVGNDSGLQHTDGVISGNELDEQFMRFHHDSGAGTMLLRRASANCYFSDATGAATAAITTPSALYLGSDAGAGVILDTGWLFAQGMIGQALTEVTCEGVFLGDSIMSPYYGGTTIPQMKPRVADFIYTKSQGRALSATGPNRIGLRSLAVQGYTLDDMLTGKLSSWDAWSGRTLGSPFVVIQGGVNSIVGDGTTPMTVAAWVAKYEALIAEILTDLPTARIYPCTMTPCATYLATLPGAVAIKINFDLANAEIAAGLAGATSYIDTYASLDAGGGVLAAAYDNGDGIHTNQAGRALNGATIRAALVTAGELP